MSDRETLLTLLPPYGARVRPEHAVESSGLPAARAWSALAALCCDGVATVREGWLTRGRDDAGVARRRAA